MDIELTKSFFKVWFKLGPYFYPVKNIDETGAQISHVVEVAAGEAFELSVWLPSYTINGDLWVAVGYRGPDERDLIGLCPRDPTIQPIPFTEGEAYICSPTEILGVTLSTPRPGYEVIFNPTSHSITQENGTIYYTITVESEGYALPLRFAVKLLSPDINIDINGTFADYFNINRDFTRILFDPTRQRRSPAASIQTECAICLNNIDEDCRAMRCTHIFCTTCITQWLRTRSTCPVCRTFM